MWILIIVIIYLFAIWPGLSDKKERMRPFEQVFLTHRGFYDNITVPENSLKAFRRTVSNGLGTELDVQMTKDGKLVVFHDHDLKRICNVDKTVSECAYEELKQYHLLDTEERIPLFSEVLEILRPDTPLIVEIKPEKNAIETTEETVKLLSRYERTYAMESFDPRVIRYLYKNHPDIIRGQLSYNMLKDKENRTHWILRFLMTNLLGNFLTHPDFIAYHVHSRYNPSFLICSRLYRTECVAWTVKNEDDLAYARKYCQQVIFDSFVPSEITVRD